MNQRNLIEKYPYLGYSPNLIEYFGIIGYPEEFIPQIIKEINKGNTTSNPFKPTILNSVISNIDYGTTDNDLMLTQIFPDNPKLIKANINDYKDQVPQPSSIIYSFCFDSTDGKKKLFYTCYAYKFYEIYKQPNKNTIEIYYVPKAFSIISQYAFYNTFHYICENLLNIINSEGIHILPMEILIYCILNYLPTPMNYNINLNVFDYILKTDSLKLGQLSGYPYIDFDLSEIANLMPINFFLEIYLITFLEQKMLFFSQNLEILNMIMYIMFSLNYPCNDSIYFWHIVSVSVTQLTEENRFVGKVMDSLLGVNSAYDDSINTSAFGSYYFIVDLDNKKMTLKYSELEPEEEEDVNDLMKIQEFLQNCIKDKNIESAFLKNFIKELKTNVDNLLVKDSTYNIYLKNKNVNFFKISPKIIEKNKKIQESFYNFCLNVLKLFYMDNELNTSFDKITNKENKLKNILKINGKKIALPEEEKLFCEFFRDSIKYKIYYENFIQNFDMMDIFKIPLLFSEEFINLKLNDKENNYLTNLSFFKIIDTLYVQSMPQIIDITINNFFSEYLKTVKKALRHIIINDNANTFERQLFCLNRKILNKFIYILNNNYSKEEIIEIFPSSKLQSADFITSFDRRCIKDIIQNYLIDQNIIKTSHCIIYSIVYIFALTMSLHPFPQLLTFLCEILKSLDYTPFFKRYYINIIILTFHNYYLINEKENLYPEMNLNNMKIFYFIIGNYLKQNGIIPDEEMMKVLSSFFGGTVLRERENKIINNNQINNENNNAINGNNNNYQLEYNTPFQIKFKYNFFCFMKYSFQNSGIIKQRNMVKAALKENRISNIIINTKKKILHPIIVVKIKDYIYTSEFFSPIKILKGIAFIYSDFIENFNYNIRKVDLKSIREMIVNLIQYGIELNSVKVPFDFLIYTLYSLRNTKKE